MVSPRLLLVLLAACEADVLVAGSTASDPPAGDDAGPPVPTADAAATPADDASSAPPQDAAPVVACDTTKPFGAPQPVAGLGGGAYKEGARLDPKQLTLFFAANSSGPISLYQATRPDPLSAFGNVLPIPGMPLTAPSFAPSPTGDQLLMVFGQQQVSGEMHLAMAKRTTPTAAFDAPAQLSVLNPANSSAQPYLRVDGKILYFVSNRVDAKYMHLYRASYNGSAFDPATRVTEIALAGGERYPAVTGDDLTLYFSSLTSTQKGGADIWRATRASINDPFGAPVQVPELNGTTDDDVTWVSPDDCFVYVRRGDATTGAIFAARRP